MTSLEAPLRLAVFSLGGRVAVVNFTELPIACQFTGFEGKARKLRRAFGTEGAGREGDGATLRLLPHGLLVVE